ncbi:MAG: EMC3/TMCO1 family protein [Candidatus ainarchaeum sp.]|nr:EMC3/TMCO1 family protein [Candidatus ainarchaeum sp.]
MVLISPIVDIAIISFFMAIVSQILQRKLIDRKKMKESQEKMKQMQKQMNELLKRGDEKSKLESSRIQNEMLQLMNAQMKGSMKHMLVSLPIFWIVFAAIGAFYIGVQITSPLPLPIIHRNFAFEITPNVSWLWWYIYCSLAFSVVLSIILNILDKMKAKTSEKTLQRAEKAQQQA